MYKHKCEHATESTQGCAGCATLRSAEAIVLELQRDRAPEAPAQAFPRSPTELAGLTVLQRAAPRSLTANRIAALVDLAPAAAQRILYGLSLVEAVTVNEKGYYRYRPTHLGETRP